MRSPAAPYPAGTRSNPLAIVICRVRSRRAISSPKTVQHLKVSIARMICSPFTFRTPLRDRLSMTGNACIPLMDSEHNHSLSHPFFPGEHRRRGTSCPQSPASTRTSITCDCIYHNPESMPYSLLPSPKTYLHAMHVLVHAHQVLHAHQVSGNPMHKINFWSILTCRHVTTCYAFKSFGRVLPP